jgi:hypothetical protein
MKEHDRIVQISVSAVDIKAVFHDRDHSRLSQPGHPGGSHVSARVLREGSISGGDPVRLLDDEEARVLIRRP